MEPEFIVQGKKGTKGRNKATTRPKSVGGPRDVQTNRSFILEQGVELPAGNFWYKKNLIIEVASQLGTVTLENVVDDQSLPSPPQKPERNYDTLPVFQGSPQVGDKLAFKMVILSSRMSPEPSDWIVKTVSM